MLEETTTNFTLYLSTKEILFGIIIGLIAASAFISSPFISSASNGGEIPHVIFKVLPVFSVLIITDIISTIYKVFHIKAGIVFNEVGITNRHENNLDVKWEEIEDLGLNIGNVLVIKIKSIDEYIKRYGFFKRNLLLLKAYISQEPLSNELGINLEEYTIKNQELFDQEIQLMKERHLGLLHGRRELSKVQEKEKLILYYSKKKPIIITVSALFILIVISSPLFKTFKYVIGDPKIILIGFLILGFVVVVNLILGIYRIVYPKIGVVFNEKGIKIEDELSFNIEWEEVADMEIGRKKCYILK